MQYTRLLASPALNTDPIAKLAFAIIGFSNNIREPLASYSTAVQINTLLTRLSGSDCTHSALISSVIEQNSTSSGQLKPGKSNSLHSVYVHR